MSHAAYDISGALLALLVNAEVEFVRFLAHNFIVLAIAAYFIFTFTREIRSIRDMADAAVRKAESIESNIKQFDQRVSSLEGGACTGKLSSKSIEEVIDRRFNCSLTNIYNEKQLLGHEWQYKVEDGHWVTAIYSEKTKKFIVKHFRTDENTQKVNLGERILSDMRHNAENIYAGLPGDANGMQIRNGIYVPEG